MAVGFAACLTLTAGCRAHGAEPSSPALPEGAPGASGLWQQPGLLGNPWRIGDSLKEHGVETELTLTADLLRSATGGYRQATNLTAQLALGLSLDTDAAFGWPGGRFYSSMFAVSGNRFTVDDIGSLATASTIEAERSLRLFELWYEQAFLHGRASLRFGQLAADEEFLITTYGQVFVDGNFGWPTLPAADLPSGGASYPFAAPAVRLKLMPTERSAILLGLFSGDPAPAGFSDGQQVNRNGTNFLLDRGAFVIGEVQLGVDLGAGSASLPGTWKLGAWWNSNRFLDPHRDASGLSLTDLNSTGFPALHHGDWSVYGVIDQAIWQRSGAGRVGAFARLMAAPDDRNQVSAQFDFGLNANLLASRPHDTLALGFGWFKISEAARALDRDIVALGFRRPVRSAETLLEATYRASLSPWWQLQPDVQWIHRPGGGVPSPQGLARNLGDALIFGVRTTINF